MQGGPLALRTIIDEPCTLHERPQIVEGNAPIDLRQSALDYMLQLGRIEDTGS